MNDMSSPTTAAPIIQDLTPDAKRAIDLPHDTCFPDLSGQPWLVDTYPYYGENGAPIMLVAHYKHPEQAKNKTVIYTPWRTADGAVFWSNTGTEDPWPLYNRHDIFTRSEDMIIFSEAEISADAVKIEFPDCISTTCFGGVMNLNFTDTSHLKGREVVFFPAHTDDKEEMLNTMQSTMASLGLKRFRVLDITNLAKLLLKTEEVPQGYNFANAVRDGLSGDTFKFLTSHHPHLLTEMECHPNYITNEIGDDDKADAPTQKESIETEDPVQMYLRKNWGDQLDLPDGFSLDADGIYKHGITGRNLPTSTYAGPPLAVVGRCHTGGGKWGYVMTFLKPDGTWKIIIVPGRLLAGDGKEMRETLADEGYASPPDRAGRQAQAEYITYSKSTELVEIASRPGWCAEVYALPQRVIMPAEVSRKVQLDMQGRDHFFAESGSLQDWEKLAVLVEHSSRPAFVICASLAGALLRPLGEGGGGFHFYGLSSRGKTTLLRLAGSTWGGGGPDGFVRNWKMTDNSVEAVAADHNDAALPLDELGMLAPDQAAAIFYMLANGHGKGRASKNGNALTTAQWNVIILSNGEDPSATHIKSGNPRAERRLTGGLAVRMVDIPIEPDAGKSFEDLAGFESEGALAEHIGHEACSVYGHAGPAFVQHLVNDLDRNLTLAREIMDVFMSTVSEADDDHQVRRVARRFALVAAAGTLATRFGVLPWQAKSAIYAALSCYNSWKISRGTNRSEEEREALTTLTAFFELHGPSRFQPVNPQNTEDDPQMVEEKDWATRERCGYRTTDHEGNAIYYVFPEAFRSQICNGHGMKVALNVARELGALILGEDARPQKKVRLPEYPNGKRIYAIMPHKLTDK